mmetsp:Transcript_2755/g.5900  ORF Transcript_2755/g.5900 Transcript_2755/m.5900 type:complete len:414 (+) Transcript_2755:65-1306(+)
MKALAFLSSLSTIRSRSHHPWGATQRQNRQQPPTRQLTSIHHHDVTSCALFLLSSNEHHDDYNHIIDDDNSESNEAPSIVQCSTQNDFHQIYQMNAAALQQLFTKQQQRQDNITQQSANDSSETSRIINSRISTNSSHTFIERVLNCTTAIDDDTSTSISDYDSEVYFVAIQHDNDNDNISTNNDNILLQSAITNSDCASLNDLPSTNENNDVAIMGIVAIQLRHKSPLIAGPSTTATITNTNISENNDSDDNFNPRGDGNTDLPAVALPTPHFYILTVQVDEQFRQRGIGLSLLHAVVEYGKGYREQYSHHVGLQQQQNGNGDDDSIGESKNENLLIQKLRQRQQNRRNKHTNRQNSKASTNDEERIPIVLSVNTGNIPAVRLYEKFGFEYLERNEVFCMMVLRPGCVYCTP